MTNDEARWMARAIAAANHHPDPDAYADAVRAEFAATNLAPAPAPEPDPNADASTNAAA